MIPSGIANHESEGVMTSDERTALINKYRDGYRTVQEALAGVTPAELQEIFMHASEYCGFPAALDAFRAGSEVIDAQG